MMVDLPLRLDYVSPHGGGASYVSFADEAGEVTLQVGWDWFVQAGRPSVVTVSIVSGRVVLAGSYSSL